LAIGAWIASGFYVVDQGEQAVELQFGKYQESKEAGLRWHAPYPIETVEIVNVQQVNTVEVGYRSGGRRQATSVPREALMLTRDENIIDIHFAVQYDVKDPRDLLFNVAEYNPRDKAEAVVRQATESAVREIVGRNDMDFAITEGRAQIAQETRDLLQQILDRYKTGVNIRAVEMQNAQPPAEVKAAFDDAVKAREDEERLKNLAEAYANDVIPKARGAAARVMQEAEAYKASTIARADGDASRFTQVLSEYQKAPDVTRERMYLDTMQEVLARSNKMVIDQKSGNSVMYLPLDQLMKNRGQQSGGSVVPSLGGQGGGGPANTAPTTRSADRPGRFER
ncbi:MAG: FtsH protease activity modulator HflK, partial [Pseudomonadota bacterium]|nr:FtsH protease activity modulator HflK [Pseudomonadota bacterium]